MKQIFQPLLVTAVLLLTSFAAFGHCDSKDGPVVGAAIKAIAHDNVNYALIWVKPEYEKQVKEAFESTMRVRRLSKEAEKLADNCFFETLVRLHRAGEGMAYTGLKPHGTPVDNKIQAADSSISVGNLSPLMPLVPKEKRAELKKRFDKVMSLKNYDVNDVAAGRKYVEAYVHFFHFAEGKHEAAKEMKHKH